jgi:hypothetical protein
MASVPVTGLAANFSPMLRMAPPPLGREMEGAAGFCSPSGRFVAFSGEAILGLLAAVNLPMHGGHNHLFAEQVA